jgi:hypothetical protein
VGISIHFVGIDRLSAEKISLRMLEGIADVCIAC